MSFCECGQLVAIDYGADENGKLKVSGPDGPVPLPVTPRGLTPAEKFTYLLGHFLASWCVVCESPTPGASGAEAVEIAKVAKNSPHDIFLISARRVKNYLKDNPEVEKTDEECARIIYEIATRPNAYLKPWHYVPRELKYRREHTSVRPYDKRKYKGEVPDAYMDLLAPFQSLPEEIQSLFGNGLKRKPDYRRAAVLPFAMAFTEKEGRPDTRDGYENIIGLHENGYPSFYRRCTVTLMQAIAKKRAGVTRFAEVTPAQRKEAWKEARRVIRCIYYLSRQHQKYVQATGTSDPQQGHKPSQTA